MPGFVNVKMSEFLSDVWIHSVLKVGLLGCVGSTVSACTNSVCEIQNRVLH
jgi:hypothetical protein